MFRFLFELLFCTKFCDFIRRKDLRPKLPKNFGFFSQGSKLRGSAGGTIWTDLHSSGESAQIKFEYFLLSSRYTYQKCKQCKTWESRTPFILLAGKRN